MTNETDDLLNELLGTTTPTATPAPAAAPEPTPAAPKKKRTAKAKAAPAPAPAPAPEPDVVKVAEPPKPFFVATIEDAPDWTPPPPKAEEPAVEVTVQASVADPNRAEDDYSHLSSEQHARLMAEQAAGRNTRR